MPGVVAAQRRGKQNGSPSTLTHLHTHTHRTQHHTPQPLMSLHTPPTYTLHHQQPTLNHPPDPETKRLSKIYFKLIQSLHHKQIMDTASRNGRFPPGMSRQVSRLTDFFKPSGPTPETHNLIQHNTEEWMRKIIHILQQHYTCAIDKLTLNLASNHTALTIATSWARKRYGTRLQSNTLQQLQTILHITPTTTTHTHTTNNSYPHITSTQYDKDFPALTRPTPLLPLPSPHPYPTTTLRRRTGPIRALTTSTTSTAPSLSFPSRAVPTYPRRTGPIRPYASSPSASTFTIPPTTQTTITFCSTRDAERTRNFSQVTPSTQTRPTPPPTTLPLTPSTTDYP